MEDLSLSGVGSRRDPCLIIYTFGIPVTVEYELLPVRHSAPQRSTRCIQESEEKHAVLHYI